MRGGIVGLRQLTFEFRNAPVLQFRHALQIARTSGSFKFEPRLVEGFLDVGSALHVGFFSFPDFFQIGRFDFQTVDFSLQIGEAFFGSVVGFLFQGFAFDLELD